MAHVQQQQGGARLVQSPGILKLQAPPLPGLKKCQGSLQPQENDDDDAAVDASLDQKKELTRRISDCSQHSESMNHDEEDEEDQRPTLLPELERICDLTQRITQALARDDWTQQELEDDEDTGDSGDHDSLSSLYCARATALLQHVQYDASARIPLGLVDALGPELVQSDSVASIATDGWCAVKQALDDAMAAIASDARAIDAFNIAAQCHRSMGNPEAAIDLVQSTLRLDPHNRNLHTLMRQLLQDTTHRGLAPPLLCRSHGHDETQQLEEDENEDDDHDDALVADVARRFHALKELSDSRMLASLETMRHEVRHHQCASADDAKALAKAADDTIAFLRVLLEDTVSSSRALRIDIRELYDTAKLLTDTRRVLDSLPMRRWLVKTLAPAVVQGLTSSECIISASVDSRAAVLRDVLLTLARLLLALGGLQRCTNEPHAIATSKLAYDLTKQLTTDPQAFLRLELAGKDAYALALMDLADEAGEAIVLHQETLDKALEFNDHDRVLVSRHLLGRALLHMRDVDTARFEFTTLLDESLALGDSATECLALVLLGECRVTEGDLDEGLRYLRRALVVCNQTAQCHGTWRHASIERAIDFYACLLRPPQRRAAMRRASGIKPRKATLVVAPATDSWAWDSDEAPAEPKRRHGAVWMSAPLYDVEAVTPRRTLAETVIGGYNGEDDASEASAETAIESEEGEESDEGAGPLTTLGISLATWLISRQSTACCKPVM